MSTKTEVKNDEKPKSALKEHVLSLANRIEEAMKIDAKTGIVTTGESIYEQTLPEDLTIEVANKVHKHDADFIAASTHAIGRIAVDAMKGNKKLETAETVIAMAGKNSLSLHVDRTRSYPNPQDKDAPIVKQGVVTVTYDVAADAKVGQLKIARNIISELAAAALK